LAARSLAVARQDGGSASTAVSGVRVTPWDRNSSLRVDSWPTRVRAFVLGR